MESPRNGGAVLNAQAVHDRLGQHTGLGGTSLRFAIAVCSMILMLAAIASVLPSRLKIWRKKAQERSWSEIDFSASLTDGQVISLTYVSDAVHPINAAIVDRISACSGLEGLSLGPSNAGDGCRDKM